MVKTVTTDLNIEIKKVLKNQKKIIKGYQKMQTEIKETKQEQKKLVQQSETNFSKARTSVLNYAKSFVAITAAITVLRGVVKTIVDFDKALANLSAITGAVGKDLDFLSNKAIELSKSSTLSAAEVVEAFKLVGSAVPELLKSGDALAEVTEKAIILSEAAGIDLNTAAKALGETLNQFSLDASESARVINVLAAASQLGAKEIPFVNDALSKFGGVAQSAGVNIEEAAAAVEILGKVIPQAETVGRSMRNTLIILQTEAAKAGREFLGLSKELELLAPDLDNIIKLDKTFGKENILAIQTLIKEREEFVLLTDAITGTNTALEQQAINTDTLADNAKKVGNAWKNFILSLESGDSAIGNTANVLLKGLTTALNEVSKGAQRVGLTWKNLTGQITFEEFRDASFALEGFATEGAQNIELLRKALVDGNITFKEFSKTVNDLLPDNIANKVIAGMRQIAGLNESGGKGGGTTEAMEEEITTVKDLKDAIKALNIEIDKSTLADAPALVAERNVLQERLNKILGKQKKEVDKVEKATFSLFATEEQLALLRLDNHEERLKELDEEKEKIREVGETQVAWAEKLSQIEQENRDKKKEDAIRAAEAIAQIADNLLGRQSIILDQQRQAEIQAATEKIKDEERLADEINKINTEFAKQQQEIAKKQAAIDLGVGIIKIWSETGVNPIVAGLLTAGLVAVFARNIALIESQSFAEGGFTGKGGRVDQTGERVAGTVHANEFVFDKQKTAENRDLFEAIHKGKIDHKGLAKAAGNYENRKDNNLANNIANSLLMQAEMKGVEGELGHLNKKNNTTNNLLRFLIRETTGKEPIVQ